MAKNVDRVGVFEELFEAHYWAVRAYALRRAAPTRGLSFGQELQVSDMFRTHDAEVPAVERRELRFS
jgi:hypothetical protein